MRVEDLKRVLSGTQLPVGPPTRDEDDKEAEAEDTGSDSMVSYEGSDVSFVSANTGLVPVGPALAVQVDESPEHGGADVDLAKGDTVTEGTITPRPLTAASQITAKKSSTDNAKRKSSITSQPNEEIPPVPPLPAGLRSLTPSSLPSSPPSTGLTPDVGRTTSVSKKTQSITSLGSLRDRPRTANSVTSRSNRQSTQSARPPGWTWNARDLLDDIDAEAPSSPGSLGVRGVGVLSGKPPY